MNRACLSALLLSLPIVAACGGKVVYESGVDGAGGASSSNSTSSSTGATGTSTTDTTVASSSAQSVTTTSTSSVMTSSSSGGFCDNQGNCGDNGSGCIGCALAGPCAGALDACGASQECVSFADCSGQCDPADQLCNQKCADTFPEGAAVYFALVDCVICQECASDCGGGAGFPCPGGA